MYLSRLYLNNRQSQAARDLRSAYSFHQTVRWAFEGAGETRGPLPDGERLLWRNDDTKGILLQSQTRPDWQALEDRWPGYLQDVQLRELDLSGIGEGQEFLFRLRANVTVNRYRDGQDKEADPRTKREAVRGAVEQVQWLERQGARGGFGVRGTDITHSGNVRLYKKQGSTPMTLFAVTFEGMLQVQDAPQFVQSVQGGIGKGKALGFGLLSLIRPKP